jgi:hypothetical protein
VVHLEEEERRIYINLTNQEKLAEQEEAAAHQVSACLRFVASLYRWHSNTQDPAAFRVFMLAHGFPATGAGVMSQLPPVSILPAVPPLCRKRCESISWSICS